MNPAGGKAPKAQAARLRRGMLWAVFCIGMGGAFALAALLVGTFWPGFLGGTLSAAVTGLMVGAGLAVGGTIDRRRRQ